MQTSADNQLPDLTRRLHQTAADLDAKPAWPAEEWNAIAAAGLLASILPEKHAGNGCGYARILQGYRAVAAGSVALALILTQRDSAVDLIARGHNDLLRGRLPEHAAGTRITSVGISQVTTSKAGPRPKLRATPTPDGYRLDGLMPWVSGATACDEIVTAAVLEDGRQILAAVPCDSPGLRIDPPMRLLALEASCTSVVHCDGVQVSDDAIIKPPSEAALTGRAPVKGLTVISVGLGLSDRILATCDDLREKTPPELWDAFLPLRERQENLSADFERAAAAVAEGGSVEATPIRVALNDLLTRLGAALVNLGKGSGYVRGHLPERLLREALFFQVWSIPDPVRVETLQRLR